MSCPDLYWKINQLDTAVLIKHTEAKSRMAETIPHITLLLDKVHFIFFFLMEQLLRWYPKAGMLFFLLTNKWNFFVFAN